MTSLTCQQVLTSFSGSSSHPTHPPLTTRHKATPGDHNALPTAEHMRGMQRGTEKGKGWVYTVRPLFILFFIYFTNFPSTCSQHIPSPTCRAPQTCPLWRVYRARRVLWPHSPTRTRKTQHAVVFFVFWHIPLPSPTRRTPKCTPRGTFFCLACTSLTHTLKTRPHVAFFVFASYCHLPTRQTRPTAATNLQPAPRRSR